MPKKKLPQTIEECNAELERTQKQLQQYGNRNKMLNRKLSVEKRRERNHRIFLYGGFKSSGKWHQGIHTSYDFVGFIPVEELLKQETA